VELRSLVVGLDVDFAVDECVVDVGVDVNAEDRGPLCGVAGN